MVIGNGLIAKSFHSYKTKDDFLIFASGVSDSKNSKENEFKKEHDLLKEAIQNNSQKKIIYFSTCSVTDTELKETLYVKHKINMENLIRKTSSQYHIFRLSNLAGFSNNPNTILNFFYFHIVEGKHFDLWKNSERNIIDVEDVYRVADYILTNNLFLNQIVNVANIYNYSVNYIIKCIENFTGKKAIFTEKEKGAKLFIDVSDVKPLLELLKIEFTKDYLHQLLVKYYPQHDL
jgi:nucleoside-diphosphate-sugar epimerase